MAKGQKRRRFSLISVGKMSSTNGRMYVKKKKSGRKLTHCTKISLVFCVSSTKTVLDGGKFWLVQYGQPLRDAAEAGATGPEGGDAPKGNELYARRSLQC